MRLPEEIASQTIAVLKKSIDDFESWPLPKQIALSVLHDLCDRRDFRYLYDSLHEDVKAEIQQEMLSHAELLLMSGEGTETKNLAQHMALIFLNEITTRNGFREVWRSLDGGMKYEIRATWTAIAEQLINEQDALSRNVVVLTGDSALEIAVLKHSHDLVNERREKWINALFAENVVAAYPDDGWVDREQCLLRIKHIYFQLRPLAIGSVIALGNWEKYRLARITGVNFGVHIEDWKFEYTSEEIIYAE